MASEIEDLLDKHLQLMATDVDAWAELLTDDVIVDFPYAHSLGRPPRLEGKAAAYNHIKTSVADMQGLTFSDVRKYPTQDPNLLWAELHAHAYVPSTGKQYDQDYAVKLITRDGKTARYSEYWNPMAMAAFQKD